MILLAMVALIPFAAHAGNTVIFQRTDEPGRWFKNLAGPIAGTQSLAVVNRGAAVTFIGNSSRGVHTVTSLIFPTGTAGMPF